MGAVKQAVSDIVYEIVTSKEKLRISIPANYKITYGKLHAGGDRPGGSSGNVLRIYEAENKQRAIFHDVISFRDIGLPLTRFVPSDDEYEPGKWESVT